MAKNTIAYYTKSGRAESVTIPGGGGSTTVFTAGAEGTKILGIYISNHNSSGASSMEVEVNNGVTTYNILTKANAATGDDLLDATKLPKNSNGIRYFNIESGSTIKIRNNAVSSAEVVVYGEDY